MANLYKIKTLAESKGISIRDLAERVGIGENRIHVMCRTNSTKIETLEKIAQVLGVSISEFFDDLSVGKTIRTEGDYSPASDSGDISVVVGDALLAEKVKSLETLVAEKNERIVELKERIEELKGR